MSQLRWGTEAPNDTAAARERLVDAAEACFQRFGVMKTTIEALQEAGVRDKVKVLIGGAPVTKRFAEDIGADGTSNNAVGAVVVAKLAMGIPVADVSGVHLCMR